MLILAEELADACLERYGLESQGVIATVKGAALEHLKLRHPFYDKNVPVIVGDHVTLDAGTGLVHTAPAHGLEDYVVGMQYKLPVENPVGDDGKFYAKTPLFGGLSVWKANDAVIETLKQNDRLLHLEKLQHSYPHCWRHKTPVIFRATSQWFIGMDLGRWKDGGGRMNETLRDIAKSAVEATAFFPSWGRARLEGMIGNRPDWCVSRQRNWGVPMPLFVHQETGELHPRTLELLEQVAQARRAGRHRGLVQARASRAARRGRCAPLPQAAGHAGRVVRFRHDPRDACCASAKTSDFPPTFISKARTSTAAGSSRRC